jgi:hypothetical protein
VPRLRMTVLLPAAAAVLAAGVAAAAPSTPASAACGSSPADNGTGYRPPSNQASLPTGQQRPGPAILHRKLATAPQLRNTGPWRAEPLMVSGTRGYRNGEFLYQDFLYDDRALTYPADPGYAGNAADLVEVRVRLVPDGLAVRLTYNSMTDPSLVAATVAIGDSGSALALPHGAGAVSKGQVFVTVHGCQGDAVRASDGRSLGAVRVSTDLARRQVEVRVPHTILDLRRERSLRIAAAAGLWDGARDAYLRPDENKPAFFNVAFREYGPFTQNTWMDQSQNAALAAGDLSSLSATVDIAKLRAQVRDDLVGKPGGLPRSGPINRIHVSHFEPTQGRGNDTAGGSAVGDFMCDPPECTPQYSGRLQPYTVYVPSQPPPDGQYGLVLNLHGASSNHNHVEGGAPAGAEMYRMLAETGRPSLMLLPNARGASYFYHGIAAADVFEAWADAAAHYPLDPRFVVQSGSSMGGYGTYKLASQFPDLYLAAAPNIGPGGPLAGHVPQGPQVTPATSDAWRMLASLRNVPVLSTNNLNDPIVPYSSTGHNRDVLERLGYRYDFWFFTGASGGAGHAEYRHLVPGQYGALTRDQAPLDSNPRRVTYVLNAALSDARYGLVADKAYWVSGLRLRDAASSPVGSVDVTTLGQGRAEPVAAPADTTAGPGQHGSLPFLRQRRSWAAAPGTVARDELHVAAVNVGRVVVDVSRAGVTCNAVVRVESDGPVDVVLAGRGCRRVVQGRPGTG